MDGEKKSAPVIKAGRRAGQGPRQRKHSESGDIFGTSLFDDIGLFNDSGIGIEPAKDKVSPPQSQKSSSAQPWLMLEKDQMQQELDDAKSRISDLKRDLKSEQDKYEKLKTEGENTKNLKQKTLESRLTILETEKDQMEERLTSQIAALTLDIKSEQDKIQKLKDEAEVAKNLKQKTFESTLSSLEMEKDQIEERLEMEKDRMEERLENAKFQITALTSDLKSEQDKNQKLKDEAETAMSLKQKSFDSMLTTLEMEKDLLEKQRENARSQIAALTSDLESEQDKNKKLRYEAETATDLNQKTFKSTLSSLEIEKELMDKRLEDAKSQIVALKRDLKSEQDKNQKLNDQAESVKNLKGNMFESTLSALEMEKDQLEERLKDAKSQIMALTSDLKSEQDKNLKLKYEAETVKNQKTYDSTLPSLEMDERLENAKSQIAALSCDLKLEQDKNQRLKYEVDTSKKQKMFDSTLPSLDMDKDLMEKILEDAKSQIMALTSALKSEQDKNQQLQYEAEIAKQKTFEFSLPSLDMKKDLLEQRLEMEKDLLEKRLGNAMSQITALTLGLKSEQDKNQKLKDEAESAKQKIFGTSLPYLEMEKDLLEKQLQNAKSQIMALTSDLKSEQDKNLKLKYEAETGKKQKMFESSFPYLEMDKDQLEKRLEYAKSQIGALTLDLKSEHDKNQMLKYEAENAKFGVVQQNPDQKMIEARLTALEREKYQLEERLKSQFTALSLDLKSEQDKNKKLKVEAETAKVDHQTAESVEDLRCRSKSLEHDLAETLKKHGTLKKKYHSLQKLSAEANKEIVEIKKRLEVNLDVLERSKQTVKAHELCAEKEKNANKTIDDLKDKLEAKNEKFLKNRGYVNDITDTIKRMLNKDKLHPNKVSQLFESKLTDLAEKTLENGNLRAKVTELEEKIADLNADLEAVVVAEEAPKKKKKGFFKKLGAKIRRRQSDEAKQKKDTTRKLQAKIEELELLNSRLTTETNNAKMVHQGLEKVISNVKTKEQFLSDEIAKLRYKVRVRDGTIEKLHDALKSFEELTPVTPVDLERDNNAVLRDVVLINQFKDSDQSDFRYINPLKDLTPFIKDGRPGQTLTFLAEGSYGLIELGRLASSGVPIVVKSPTMTSKVGDKLESVEMKANILRAKKEATILHMFSENRLFPRFHGVVKMMNQMSLVLEFVGDKKMGKTTTLFNVLSKLDPEVPFPTKVEIAGIADDIVEAVSALHEKSILHNDIKADNVLLEKRKDVWRAILIDFGEATSFAVPLVRNSSISMRMQYTKGLHYLQLAPEVVLDQQPTSAQTDIFSVGKILQKIGARGQIEDLMFLGEICSKENPHQRPETMREVSAKVLAVKVKVEKEAENHRL